MLCLWGFFPNFLIFFKQANLEQEWMLLCCFGVFFVDIIESEDELLFNSCNASSDEEDDEQSRKATVLEKSTFEIVLLVM